jgi:hypothetical protein
MITKQVAPHGIPVPMPPPIDRSIIQGEWGEDLRSWVMGSAYEVYAGRTVPRFRMAWTTFASWFTSPCTSAQDEIELGSRVCAAFCKENCRGFQVQDPPAVRNPSRFSA